MLERYCQALGLDVFDPAVYGAEASSFESEVPMPERRVEMTLNPPAVEGARGFSGLRG
jgi:hypothetical protein